jgi:hypothetical protein
MKSIQKSMLNSLESVAHSMWATLEARLKQWLMRRKFILMRTVVQSAVPRHTGGNRMARSSHHVVHNPKGGWDVKRSGAQRSSGHYSTKEQAVNAGRQISRNQGTEFVIHGLNGRIQSADSHGGDPYPPKG